MGTKRRQLSAAAHGPISRAWPQAHDSLHSQPLHVSTQGRKTADADPASSSDEHLSKELQVPMGAWLAPL